MAALGSRIMSNITALLTFLCTGTLLVSLLHFYFWRRLIRDTGLNKAGTRFGTWSLILLAVSFPAAIAASSFLSFRQALPIVWVAYLWLGMTMLLFVILFSKDLLSLQFYVIRNLTGVFSGKGNGRIDVGRRKFISRSVALGASIVVPGFSIVGVKNYYANAVVNNLKVALAGLPDAFKGFKIVQISDLHIGQIMTGATLKEIVAQVNSLQPDLIAITGDLADGTVAKLLNEITSLKDLHAEHGVYFVTGNHEYYSGVEEWTVAIEKMGIKVLNNENVKISKENEWLYLAGVTDHEAKKFGKQHAADFNKALSGLEKDKTKILLAHQPIAVKEAAEYGTDLVLAGHTHGGQVWPFKYIVYLQQRYVKGFHKYKNTTLYINQGTGCWGPPLRLGSYNEITEMVLV